jgi:cytochrome P450
MLAKYRIRKELSSSSSASEASDKLIGTLLRETQRLHPAAPFTMRVVDDQDLEVGGNRVPKGWLVSYAIAGTLLSDDETYPLSNSFQVDRWLAEKDAPPVWAFGGGKRICPGKALSIVESVMLFKEVLGSSGFQWTLRPDQDISYRYTPEYFPVDGLRVHLANE